MDTYHQMIASIGRNIMKSDKELHAEFSQNYFYPNVCQYCNQISSDLIVKRCFSCESVYYCSSEHQVEHYEEHKDFCTAFTSVRKRASELNILKNVPGNSGKNLTLKAYLIEATESLMKRPIRLNEILAIMFPRDCLVCHETIPSLLTSCDLCPQANFCIKHTKIPQHERLCSAYNFCFYLDFFWTVFKHIPTQDFTSVFPRNNRYLPLPENIREFISTYIKPSHPQMNFEVAEVPMHVAKLFSRSLTLIYALQKLKLTRCTQLHIHWLCKKKLEVIDYDEWEILFHWFPKLKLLKFVVFGLHEKGKQETRNLCDLCRTLKRSLKFEISELQFAKYLSQTEKQPDIILAFDVDLMTCKTWAGASEAIHAVGCPIVFTGRTQFDLLASIQDCVLDHGNFSRIERNPYASTRPERAYRNVIYPNYYISIYGDDQPKLAHTKLEHDVFQEDHIEDIEKSDSEILGDLEERNLLLMQRFEDFKGVVEKESIRQMQLEGFFMEMKDIIDRFYDLENRYHQVFGKEKEETEIKTSTV